MQKTCPTCQHMPAYKNYSTLLLSSLSLTKRHKPNKIQAIPFCNYLQQG